MGGRFFNYISCFLATCGILLYLMDCYYVFLAFLYNVANSILDSDSYGFSLNIILYLMDCYCVYSILFYSILFYSILFYSIPILFLFYSILFYSILFYSILFYSILMQEFAIIIWQFKCQVSVVAAGLLILNVHCGTVFSCMDKKVVHSLG